MSDTEVNDELTEEVRRKSQQRDELFRQWAERRKRLEEVEERRQTFANHFGVRPIKWSRHNLIRLLNKTGEPPERILELRGLLDLLGMNSAAGRHWIGCGGVWDHGEMWSKNGQPCIVVGQPYDIHGVYDEYQAALDEVARWSPRLLLSIDDRESYYFPKATHQFVE